MEVLAGLAGWECGALSWRTCQGAGVRASLSWSSVRVPGRCSCGPGSGVGRVSVQLSQMLPVLFQGRDMWPVCSRTSERSAPVSLDLF